MSTMKAIQFHEYGDSSVLCVEELNRPTAGAGEVLIRCEALGVNPVDWKIRSGAVRERVPLPLPAIVGADIAGVVEAVGEGVTAFSAGDEVFSMPALIGCYVEYVAVDAQLVVKKPSKLDAVHAASIPLAALTAWQAMFEHGDLVAGQTLLIHGAAGGVGSFAVQFGKVIGATVIATASSKNAAYLNDLGADDVFDYRSNGDSKSPEGVDMVLDLVGDNVDVLLTTLKRGGSLFQISPSGDDSAGKAAELGVTMLPVMVHPDGAQLAEIAALIEGGELVTHVEATFPIEEVGKAHDLSQAGHTRGKIVLTV